MPAPLVFGAFLCRCNGFTVVRPIRSGRKAWLPHHNLSKAAQMIERCDQQIVEWARAVVPDVTVSVSAPPPDGNAAGIYITLLAIVPVRTPRGTSPPPRELALDYLVSTAGDDMPETHDWLGALAFAAMDMPSWRVATEAVPLQLWQAFGVTPRPAFVVCLPLRLDRDEERAPLVRKPLVVAGSPIAHLAGHVVGPGETPIAGARVEIPALQLFARTDHNGAFHFPTIPSDISLSVLVRAKGQVLQLRTQAGERVVAELNENDLEG